MTDDTATETRTPFLNVLGIRLNNGDLHIEAVTLPGQTTEHRHYARKLKHWTAENEGTRPEKLEDVTVYDHHINLIPGKVLVATDDGWLLKCRDRTLAEHHELDGTEPVVTPVEVVDLSAPIFDKSLTVVSWHEFSTLTPASAHQEINYDPSHIGTPVVFEDGGYSYTPPGLPKTYPETARFYGTIRIWEPPQISAAGLELRARVRLFNRKTGYAPGEIRVNGIENAKPYLDFTFGYWRG